MDDYNLTSCIKPEFGPLPLSGGVEHRRGWIELERTRSKPDLDQSCLDLPLCSLVLKLGWSSCITSSGSETCRDISPRRY